MKGYRCCFDACFLDIISGDVEDMKALLLQLQQDNAKVSDEFFYLLSFVLFREKICFTSPPRGDGLIAK